MNTERSISVNISPDPTDFLEMPLKDALYMVLVCISKCYNTCFAVWVSDCSEYCIFLTRSVLALITLGTTADHRHPPHGGLSHKGDLKYFTLHVMNQGCLRKFLLYLFITELNYKSFKLCPDKHLNTVLHRKGTVDFDPDYFYCYTVRTGRMIKTCFHYHRYTWHIKLYCMSGTAGPMWTLMYEDALLCFIMSNLTIYEPFSNHLAAIWNNITSLSTEDSNWQLSFKKVFIFNFMLPVKPVDISNKWKIIHYSH